MKRKRPNTGKTPDASPTKRAKLDIRVLINSIKTATTNLLNLRQELTESPLMMRTDLNTVNIQHLINTHDTIARGIKNLPILISEKLRSTIDDNLKKRYGDYKPAEIEKQFRAIAADFSEIANIYFAETEELKFLKQIKALDDGYENITLGIQNNVLNPITFLSMRIDFLNAKAVLFIDKGKYTETTPTLQKIENIWSNMPFPLNLYRKQSTQLMWAICHYFNNNFEAAKTAAKSAFFAADDFILSITPNLPPNPQPSLKCESFDIYTQTIIQQYHIQEINSKKCMRDYKELLTLGTAPVNDEDMELGQKSIMVKPLCAFLEVLYNEPKNYLVVFATLQETFSYLTNNSHKYHCYPNIFNVALIGRVKAYLLQINFTLQHDLTKDYQQYFNSISLDLAKLGYPSKLAEKFLEKIVHAYILSPTQIHIAQYLRAMITQKPSLIDNVLETILTLCKTAETQNDRALPTNIIQLARTICKPQNVFFTNNVQQLLKEINKITKSVSTGLPAKMRSKQSSSSLSVPPPPT